MEKRSLQRTGGSSITVTLPKEWIEQNNLKDKDSVFLFANPEGNLVIHSTEPQSPSPVVHLKVDNYVPIWIERELIAAYLTGAEEIEIHSKRITTEQRIKIRQTTQFLMGLEIIDESAAKMLIKNILDDNTFPTTQTIEKMFRITNSMFTDVMKSTFIGDTLLAQDVINRDVEVDKLYFVISRKFHMLLRRTMDQTSVGDLRTNNYYSYVAAQLERIADHVVKIATKVPIHIQSEYRDSYQKLADQIHQGLRQSQSLVQSQDIQLAHEILDVFVLNSTEVKKIETFPVLTDSLDRMGRYIINIAETTIDYSIASMEKMTDTPDYQ